MDYSRILHKPYFIPPFVWSTASTGIIQRYNIPDDILVNPLAAIPFKASVYYRAKVSAIIQVAGTPMHQGCILASAVPKSSTDLTGLPYTLNTRMAAPHVFLYANEATSARLEIPFYVNSKLQSVDLDNNSIMTGTATDNFCNLEFYALNPLIAPTSGSTSLSVSVHFVFTELEFYVPHVDVTWTPFVGESFVTNAARNTTSFLDGIFSLSKKYTGDILDTLRGGIRAWTGLHAPEKPILDGRQAVQYRQNLNTVDAPSYFEKLDPYTDFSHITTDYTFDTDVDEMHLKELLKKPQLLGNFKVNLTDTMGTLLWSRPITPIQQISPTNYTDFNLDVQYSNASDNLLQTFGMLSRYWKGGMKVYLQAVMSNFHYCKLTIARDYSPNINMKTATPSFGSVSNLMMETLEFSAGGQIQEVKMPYCSPLNQLPVTTDFVMNALSHGMYYIYLHQPLVTNGSVATSVTFNVYVSADDDFDYFGYAVNPLLFLTTLQVAPTLDTEVFEGESAAAPLQVSGQDGLSLERNNGDCDSDIYDLRPIKSVRDYGRRFYKCYSQRITSTDTPKGDIILGISNLMGNTSEFASTVNSAHSVSTLMLLSKMYLGYSGGLKFKINLTGTTIAEVWYVPPSFSIDISNRKWIGNDPFPTGVTPVPVALQEPIREMFQFPEYQPATRKYEPTYSVQTVGVERPNYINVMPGYTLSTSDPGTSTNRIAMAGIQFEFEVPHMSPYRFVGDGVKSKNSDSASNIAAAQIDMGHLVIKFGTPVNYAPAVSTEVQAIGMEVFVAMSDNGRFGYQVMAPPVTIPALGLGAVPTKGYFQLTPSCAPVTPGYNPTAYSTPAPNPSSPTLVNIAPCYYAKIT